MRFSLGEGTGPVGRRLLDLAMKICGFCHSDIVEGQKYVNCPVDESPYHIECWDDNRGCAHLGCRHNPSTPGWRYVSAFEARNYELRKLVKSQTYTQTYTKEPPQFSAAAFIWLLLILGFAGSVMCGAFCCLAIYFANGSYF